MKKMMSILTAVTVLSFGLALSVSAAGAQGQLLPDGAEITMRNTLQDPGEPEVPFPALFGLPDDAYDENGTVSATSPEFPTALAQDGTPAGDISGLYEIDLGSDSISFQMLPDADDPFWVNVFGDFPAGKFDRYYLTFSEPHNVEGFTSTNSSVSLRIDSPTVLVVEIGEGYEMSPPMSFQLNLVGATGSGPSSLAVTGIETSILAIIGTTMIAGGAMIVDRARRHG